MVIKAKIGAEAMDEKEEEEFKSLMKPYFDEITNHIMQGFKFLAIQIGGKLAVGSSNSSHHEEKKTYGVTIFSKNGPDNRPHDFKNHTTPTTPKFLDSKENLDTPYGMKEAVDEWQQLSEECRKTLPFD